MKKYGIIYKATNLINGKVYIGQTTQKLSYRISCHIHKSKKGKSLMNRAINKYSIDNFKFEEIDIAYSREELSEKEIYHIKEYDSNNIEKGYNLSTGGEYSTKGVKHSDETKQKMSESRTGENNHFFGKHHSDKTKQKISESKIGSEPTNYKRILCIQTNEIFNSVKEASEKLELNYTWLSTQIVKNKPVKGFTFKKVE